MQILGNTGICQLYRLAAGSSGTQISLKKRKNIYKVREKCFSGYVFSRRRLLDFQLKRFNANTCNVRSLDALLSQKTSHQPFCASNSSHWFIAFMKRFCVSCWTCKFEALLHNILNAKTQLKLYYIFSSNSLQISRHF